MAPVKFDQGIKDKLEKRTIKLSAKSWEILSAQLENGQKKKSTSMYWWYGIAATIVGILFVVTQFMKNRDSDTIKNKVVENPNTIEKVKADELQNEVTSGVKQSLEVLANTQKKETIEPIVEKEIPKQRISPVIKETTVADIKSTDVRQETEGAMELIKIEEVLTFEEQKIQQVVAKVQELKENKNKVTDAEIETLLQQAQKEIALKKLYNQNTRIVNANALLQDVEEDLDRSFRTKIFDALKASYGTVKSAVVSRNN